MKTIEATALIRGAVEGYLAKCVTPLAREGTRRELDEAWETLADAVGFKPRPKRVVDLDGLNLAVNAVHFSADEGELEWDTADALIRGVIGNALYGESGLTPAEEGQLQAVIDSYADR